MFPIDPKWRFVIGLFVTFAIGVTQGAVQLTNAIPDGWIKPAVAWCGIFAFLGSSVTTAISGMGMTTTARAAAAEADPAITKVETTDPGVAASLGPKVVKV